MPMESSGSDKDDALSLEEDIVALGFFITLV
jgi:hypothetical protein